MQLYEKYRPKTLGAVIGNSKAVKTIARLMQNGIGGRALWISGASGIGKSTLARIIAGSIADEFSIVELDSADSINTATLDNIDRTMQLYAFGKGGRAYLVNESHSLKKSAIRRLLGMLERIPDHVVFIFTTTKEGEQKLFDDNIDASPLLSRCAKIELTNQGLAKPFAEHCRKIATIEKLNGRPIESYIKLAQNCKNNCRQMLMEIESGRML